MLLETTFSSCVLSLQLHVHVYGLYMYVEWKWFCNFLAKRCPKGIWRYGVGELAQQSPCLDTPLWQLHASFHDNITIWKRLPLETCAMCYTLYSGVHWPWRLQCSILVCSIHHDERSGIEHRMFYSWNPLLTSARLYSSVLWNLHPSLCLCLNLPPSVVQDNELSTLSSLKQALLNKLVSRTAKVSNFTKMSILLKADVR